VHRTTRWVQPSAMAWRKGTASNTAPSTSRRPLQHHPRLLIRNPKRLPTRMLFLIADKRLSRWLLGWRIGSWTTKSCESNDEVPAL
jgi:hypothetical protein